MCCFVFLSLDVKYSTCADSESLCLPILIMIIAKVVVAVVVAAAVVVVEADILDCV